MFENNKSGTLKNLLNRTQGLFLRFESSLVGWVELSRCSQNVVNSSQKGVADIIPFGNQQNTSGRLGETENCTIHRENETQSQTNKKGYF